jgi:uncharacterized protein YyaL (SSP411 family)
MLTILQTPFLPHLKNLFFPQGKEGEKLSKLVPTALIHRRSAENAAVYFCRGVHCQLPIHSIQALEQCAELPLEGVSPLIVE